LRAIEREGLIAPPQRDSSGQRCYTMQDIAAIQRLLDSEMSGTGLERAAELGDAEDLAVSANSDSRRALDPDLMRLAADLIAPYDHGLSEDGRRALIRGIARLLDYVARLEFELEYVAGTRVGRVRRPGSPVSAVVQVPRNIAPGS
jgi:DNA-binding transcriptional MerR regulator